MVLESSLGWCISVIWIGFAFGHDQDSVGQRVCDGLENVILKPVTKDGQFGFALVPLLKGDFCPSIP